ncbi:MAG: exodeoxyribonuclease VII small subunit [Acidobacteriota bacterium]
MANKSESYEKNFKILEGVAESLNKDEISIDDLVVKTKEALTAAKNCINILNYQKGEFKKLENEFSRLLNDTGEKGSEKKSEAADGDDPF